MWWQLSFGHRDDEHCTASPPPPQPVISQNNPQRLRLLEKYFLLSYFDIGISLRGGHLFQLRPSEIREPAPDNSSPIILSCFSSRIRAKMSSLRRGRCWIQSSNLPNTLHLEHYNLFPLLPLFGYYFTLNKFSKWFLWLTYLLGYENNKYATDVIKLIKQEWQKVLIVIK